MPAARTSTRQRDKRSNDPEYNTLINDTLQRVRTGALASYNEAARQTGVREQKIGAIYRILLTECALNLCSTLDPPVHSHKTARKKNI